MSVFLDFSKAFDTVDNDILLKKLECYGFRGFMNDWLRSYIFNRTQFVDINGIFSSILVNNCGIGQGTILGPLLFLIYVNDMHLCSDLDFIHFADDSTVYKSEHCINDLCVYFNHELSKVDKWLCANKLSLNTSKSTFCVFTNIYLDVLPNILIRNVVLSRTSDIKFLGIILDTKLNFMKHIDSVCSKLARSIGVLKKLSEFLPNFILRKLYMSVIYPHIIYCVEV